jgi:spore coat protein U-like protein
MKKTTIIAALAVVLAGVSINSYAVGTATSDLTVSAEIQANCTISTLPVTFGLYDPIVTNATSGVNKNSTGGSVTTLCTLGSSPKITLGEGVQPIGSVPAAPVRQLASSANRLGYFLYQDSGFTTVWGNTSGTGVAPTTSDGTTPVVTPVYGQITKGQNMPVGTYADTVVATVTF